MSHGVLDKTHQLKYKTRGRRQVRYSHTMTTIVSLWIHNICRGGVDDQVYLFGIVSQTCAGTLETKVAIAASCGDRTLSYLGTDCLASKNTTLRSL